jgi:hypothetical protein
LEYLDSNQGPPVVVTYRGEVFYQKLLDQLAEEDSAPEVATGPSERTRFASALEDLHRKYEVARKPA